MNVLYYTLFIVKMQHSKEVGTARLSRVKSELAIGQPGNQLILRHLIGTVALHYVIYGVSFDCLRQLAFCFYF